MDKLPMCPLCGATPWTGGDLEGPPTMVRCGNGACSLNAGWHHLCDWRRLAAGARYREALEAIVRDIDLAGCIGTSAGTIARHALED